MTLRAWRITKAKHATAAFSGTGAKSNGGRWNSLGTSIVYCGSSLSLAILEMLVHLNTPELTARYVSFEVTFDESLVTTLPVANLPKTWRKSPPPPSVQALGDQWVSSAASAILRVPSVIVPTEWNFLL